MISACNRVTVDQSMCYNMKLHNRWIDTNNKYSLRVIFSSTTLKAQFLSSLVDLDSISFLYEGELRMVVNLYLKHRVFRHS